ncbi:toxin VasX [Zymobacter sp. IVIA_5232.4 C2]|uniref:toxin VasX n=1 Tax=Zymobacter sp. IVIA_5232.4 C2 TaxID=3394855 RepID=UPI0039C376FD
MFWNSEKEIPTEFYKREPLSVEQSDAILKEVAAKSSLREKKAVGGCERCDKDGLSFLPVRYSIGENKYFENYAIATDKIKKFTSINLDQQVGLDGSLIRRESINCYFLRKLRKGYLYIFDDHPLLPLWQCYGVSNYGELVSFPINKPIPLEEIKEMDDCISGIGHPARSSLVSLRDADISRSVYLMFLEIPLSESRLKEIAKNKKWRDDHMQCFDVAAPEKSDFYFEKNDIPKHVPEYDDDNSAYWLFQEQVWQGRYHNALEASKSKALEMDTFRSLNFHIEDIHCARKINKKGFMFALKDEVGIIEQLDSQRINPLLSLRNNILPEDTSDPYSPDNCTLNERNYKWYLAILQCKKIMENFPLRGKDIDEKFKMPGYDKSYKEAQEELLNSQTEEYKANFEKIYLDCDKYINGDVKTREEMKKTVDRMYQGHVSEIKLRKVGGIEDYWNFLRNKEIERIEKAKKEVEEYCEGNDFNHMKKIIGPYQKNIEEKSPMHDSDYSLWLFEHLSNALDRYDNTSFLHNGYISKIIFDVLRHGIISTGSRWLWRKLLEVNDRKNILLRAYTLNYPDLINDKDFDCIRSISFNDDSQGNKAAAAASRTYKALKLSLNQYLKSDNKNPFHLNDGVLISYAKAIEKLYELHVYSQSTLWMEEVNRKILDGNVVPISIRASVDIKIPRLYGIVSSVCDVLKKNEITRLKTKTFRITLGEVYSLSNALYNKYVDGAHGSDKNFYGYKEIGEFGLNKPALRRNSNVLVDITLTGEENVIDELCESQKVGSSVKINSSLAEIHIINSRAFEKAFVGNFNKSKTIGLKSFVIFGFILSASNLSKNLKDLDAWWKGATTFLGVVQATLESISLRYTFKAVKIFDEENVKFVATGTVKDAIKEFEINSSNTMSKFGAESVRGYIINARIYGLVAEGISYLIIFMSLYNLMKNTIEIQEMKRKGVLSEDILRKSIANCIEFIGGVVVGITISIFFVGSSIAIVLFVLLSYLSVDRIVPEFIQMWIRRSKFGKEKNYALGGPFHSMQEEQESLYSIMRGILINATVESNNKKFKERGMSNLFYGVPLSGGTIACNSKSLAPISENKEITFCMSIPDDIKGVIDIKLESDSGIIIDFPETTIFINNEDASNFISLTKYKGELNSAVSSHINHDRYSKEYFLENLGARFNGDNFYIEQEIESGRIFNINEVIIDEDIVVNSYDKVRHIFLKRLFYLEQGNDGSKVKFSFRINCGDEVVKTTFEEKLFLE